MKTTRSNAIVRERSDAIYLKRTSDETIHTEPARLRDQTVTNIAPCCFADFTLRADSRPRTCPYYELICRVSRSLRWFDLGGVVRGRACLILPWMLEFIRQGSCAGTSALSRNLDLRRWVSVVRPIGKYSLIVLRHIAFE